LTPLVSDPEADDPEAEELDSAVTSFEAITSPSGSVAVSVVGGGKDEPGWGDWEGRPRRVKMKGREGLA